MQIETDVHCLRCDYNLRTLDEAAKCPECNMPVADTLRAVELGETGRGPARRFQLTLAGICAVLIAPADAMTAIFTLEFVQMSFWGTPSEQTTAWGSLIFIAAGATSASILAAVGALLTLPASLDCWHAHGLATRCRRQRRLFLIHSPMFVLPFVLQMIVRMAGRT